MSLFRFFNFKNEGKNKNQKTRRFALESLEERQLLDAAGLLEDSAVCLAAENIEPAATEIWLTDGEITRDSIQGAINSVADGGTIYLNAENQEIFENITAAINITKSVNIVATGNYLVTISGQEQTQIFKANSLQNASITIKNLAMGNGQGDLGGAVQMDQTSGSSITFDGCEFYNNKAVAGGAVYSVASTVNFIDCRFVDNRATGTIGGGAIFMNASAENSITIDGCYFEHNVARNYPTEYNMTASGGAAFISGGSIKVDNSTFFGNYAISSSAYGGALALSNMDNMEFTNTTIADNQAYCDFGHNSDDPQSIYNYMGTYVGSPYQVLGGGVCIKGGTTAKFTDCAITGNIATSDNIHSVTELYYGYWILGGGIFSTASQLYVYSSEITNNGCSRAALFNEGGGIFAGGANVSVENSRITKNFVGSLEYREDEGSQGGFTRGAGIMVDNNVNALLVQDLISENVINATCMYGYSFGSGVYNAGMLTIWDSSIVGNVTVANISKPEGEDWSCGAGIYNDTKFDTTEYAKVKMYRSILLNNRIIDTADRTLYTSDLSSLRSYTRFYGSVYDTRNFAADSLTDYNHTTVGYCRDVALFQQSLDQIFNDASGGDYTLTEGSLAIDGTTSTSGAYATDLQGYNRVYGATMDMGCFEYQGSTRLETPTIDIESSTPSTITFGWNAIENATSYTLLYTFTEPDPEIEDPSIWTSVTKIASTTYTLGGLVVDTPVWVRVQAIGDSTHASSRYSNVVMGMTEAIRLKAPVINCTLTGSDSIYVYWNAIDNATNYILQYSTNGSSYSQIYQGTTTFYALSNLAPGTTYYFRVLAHGTGDYSDSPYSNVTSATTSSVKLSAPANLNASAASSTSINVSWNGVANASRYTLQQSTNGTSFTTVYDGAATNFTANNLTPGTAYFFRVCAVGDGTHYTTSDYTSAVSASTSKAQLAAPANFTASAASCNTINVSWSGVANASGYQLLKSTDGTAFEKVYEGTNLSYAVTGLTSGTTYYFRVCAVGDGTHYTNSEYANTSAKTESGKLATPANFSASAVGSCSITTSWDAVANASGYQLQQSLDGSSYTTIYSGTDTAYAISSLTPGTTYYFRVCAVGDGTHFQNSDYASASAATTAAKLIAPTNFSAAATGSKSINVSWDAAANASSYQLQQSLDGSSYTTIYSGTNTAYAASALTPGTTYYFRVCAVGDGTHYTTSDYVSTQAMTQTEQLAAPTLNATAAGNTAIRVTWDGVANASSYYLEISEDNTVFTEAYSGTNLNYTATNLLSGTTYYFRITAKGDGTHFTDSDYAFAQAKTISTQLTTPEVTVTADSSSSLTASWHAIANANEYEVQFSTDKATWNTVQTSTTRSYTQTGLNPGVTYYFQVRALATPRFTASEFGQGEAATKTEKLEAVTLTATLNEKTATLEWTANAKASGYCLEQRINNEYTAIYTGTDLTYSVSDLVPGTTYNFRVKAVGDTAHYTDSDYSAASVTLPTEKLATPQLNVVSEATTSRTITLKWDAVENASGYRLKRSLDGGETYVSYMTFDSSVTEYVVTDLTPKTTYYYSLCAYGDVLHYTDSDYSYANEETPAEVLEIAQIYGETVSIYEMSVTWTDLGKNATGYRLERSINGSDFEVVWEEPRSKGTSYTEKIDSKYALDDIYTFRVCAFGDGYRYLDSDYTYVNLFTCTLTPYTNRSFGEAHGVTVNHGDNPDDLIYYSEDGENWTETPLEYSDPGTYDVYVKVCREGCQDWIGQSYVDIYERMVIVHWEGLDQKYIYNATDQSDSIKAYYYDFQNVRHDLDVTFSGTGDTFVNGGGYYVSTDRYVTIDNVFCGFTQKYKTVTMDKCQLTITINVMDKVYDGTTVLRRTATTNPTYNIIGLPEGQTVILYNGHYNFDTPDVGENKTVAFTDYAIQDVQNYRLANKVAYGTASITPRFVAVTWYGTGARYRYNGTDQSDKITGYYQQVDGTAVQVNISFLGQTGEAYGQTEFKNVGTYMMTASMAEDDPNYRLTSTTRQIKMLASTPEPLALPNFDEEDLFADYDFAEELADNLSDDLIDYAKILN